MWNQPHFIYHVDNPKNFALEEVEAFVPGTLVYGRPCFKSRRVRYEKCFVESDGQRTRHVEIYAPIHCAWLVEELLERWSQTLNTGASITRFTMHNCDHISAWSDDHKDAFESYGRLLIQHHIDQGNLRSHVANLVTPYQAVGVSWAITRPWSLSVWACGSGKTLGAILSSFTRPGPTLVLCPAKARHVWWSQVQEYTHVEPYRVRPAGERKATDEALKDYLERVGSDAFVIVGAEAIHEYMHDCYLVRPTTLILDEIHTHGSSKRWQAVHKEDGEVDFEFKKTKNDKTTRAACVMQICRMPTIKFRVGLTATPLDDGRPRRLWSQLDLLTSGGFSHSYRRFAYRYCDAQPGKFGGVDDRGSSNLEELRDRCAFLMHEVSYGESHSALPSTRVQVVYLDRSELNGAGRFSDDQTFNQAFKTLKKAGYAARTQMMETRLAEACSRKRKFVVDEVKQGVRGGGKVVVFTARRTETEVWGQQIRKALHEGDERLQDVDVWVAHGGVSETERDRIVDAFRVHTGPCVLIATGQSIGTGVDGMQTADLAIFAMLPWKPGDFVQWKGRFDRLGGSATLLKVVVATGTYDERVVEILTDKFGPIESFLSADEIKGLDTKLLGLEDEKALVDSICDQLFGSL